MKISFKNVSALSLEFCSVCLAFKPHYASLQHGKVVQNHRVIYKTFASQYWYIDQTGKKNKQRQRNCIDYFNYYYYYRRCHETKLTQNSRAVINQLTSLNGVLFRGIDKLWKDSKQQCETIINLILRVLSLRGRERTQGTRLQRQVHEPTNQRTAC